jgi:hypothetical protein
MSEERRVSEECDLLYCDSKAIWRLVHLGHTWKCCNADLVEYLESFEGGVYVERLG